MRIRDVPALDVRATHELKRAITRYSGTTLLSGHIGSHTTSSALACSDEFHCGYRANFRRTSHPIKLSEFPADKIAESKKIANGPPLQILGIDRANEAAIRPQDKQHTEVLQLRQALG